MLTVIAEVCIAGLPIIALAFKLVDPGVAKVYNFSSATLAVRRRRFNIIDIDRSVYERRESWCGFPVVRARIHESSRWAVIWSNEKRSEIAICRNSERYRIVQYLWL